MEVERPKMPVSVVAVGGAIAVLVTIVLVRWAISTILGLLRLGLLIAVVGAVIMVVLRLKPDRD